FPRLRLRARSFLPAGEKAMGRGQGGSSGGPGGAVPERLSGKNKGGRQILCGGSSGPKKGKTYRAPAVDPFPRALPGQLARTRHPHGAQEVLLTAAPFRA